MDKAQVKRIFDFLEEKGEHNAPVKWKLINNIPLTEDDLNVKGDLDLRFSSITSLPKGMEVGGDLNLRYTDIKSLPKGLEVGGDLDLIGTPLADDYDHNDDYEDELREMVYPGFIHGEILI